MNAVGHKPEEKTAIARTVPPLEGGDHLTRAEFERRYSARPDIKKAELIEGVVYMASPVHAAHGESHGDVLTWLGLYKAMTPGIRLADNASTRLDIDNEVQPDVCAWIDESAGGQLRVTEEGFLEGVPEFIVEIAASSASYDLHDKLDVYRRNGVQEYLVLQVYEQETSWYRWQEGKYEPLPLDDEGIIRSQVFPGLYFRPSLFWNGDLAGLLAVLQQGLDSREHQAFVARLKEESS